MPTEKCYSTVIRISFQREKSFLSELTAVLFQTKQHSFRKSIISNIVFLTERNEDFMLLKKAFVLPTFRLNIFFS